MEQKTQRTMVAVLQALRDAPGPLGAERIAEHLRVSGRDLGERTIRNYLAHADANGWTVNLGRRGRSLTAAGRREIEGALAIDKVGFIAARVDALAYEMTFNPATRKGTVILNVSTVPLRQARAALVELVKAYDANLGMGNLVAVGEPEDTVGTFRVPPDRFAIGTICSVSMNGLFQQARIATRSRFGGLLEIESGRPRRFTQIITYDGTTLDPLEIFIRGHMTSVAAAAQTGSGVIGASFREVPAVALPEVRRLAALSRKIGLGGAFAFGLPSQPLLDVPVPQGCAGLVVTGGLNPVAAIVESGIDTTSAAMHGLCDFGRLIDYRALRHWAPRWRKT